MKSSGWSLLLGASAGSSPLLLFVYIMNASPNWRMLLRHLSCLPCSRARARDGRRMLISSAMIPMTTSSSTRVKPTRETFREEMDDICFPPGLPHRGVVLGADGKGDQRKE